MTDVYSRTVDHLQRAAQIVQAARLSQVDLEPVALSLLFELPDIEHVLKDPSTVGRLQSIDEDVMATEIPEHLRAEAYRYAGRIALALRVEPGDVDVDDVARNDVLPGPGREELDPTGGLGQLQRQE